VRQERLHPERRRLAAQLGQRPDAGGELLPAELPKLRRAELHQLGQHVRLVNAQLGQRPERVAHCLRVVLRQVLARQLGDLRQHLLLDGRDLGGGQQQRAVRRAQAHRRGQRGVDVDVVKLQLVGGDLRAAAAPAGV
jgi:hypothetical protein